MKWEFKGFTQSTRISSTVSHNAQIIFTIVGYKCTIVALLLGKNTTHCLEGTYCFKPAVFCPPPMRVPSPQ